MSWDTERKLLEKGLKEDVRYKIVCLNREHQYGDAARINIRGPVRIIKLVLEGISGREWGCYYTGKDGPSDFFAGNANDNNPQSCKVLPMDPNDDPDVYQCRLHIRDKNGIVWSSDYYDTCPTAEGTCDDDCPEGCVKCPSPYYPGYCCKRCK
ncbi:hypothetical protein [Leptolyngbya sp. FACHB-261]|uniref:hypothetical protein n=1 Tax=Leptolyngbya sp. FACHB-261 TaxID=2692806 RepID=UPI001689D1D5|nr:hypothetical protein [Leptolyngbya sp. FACHB-261]